MKMAGQILPKASLPRNNSVQACKRAKVAQNTSFLESLHDCTPQKLRFLPISEFYLKIIVGEQVVICLADEFYFSLLAALASGEFVDIPVMTKGGL